VGGEIHGESKELKNGREWVRSRLALGKKSPEGSWEGGESRGEETIALTFFLC
jgi:hypothetical protein